MTFDQEQAATAAWMGYADTAAMNRAHDALHHALCLWLGVESQSMRVAAGEQLNEPDAHLAAIEEDAVLHLQRFMCHAGVGVPAQ